MRRRTQVYSCKCLLSQLKYETGYVPTTSTCFPIKNMNPGMYLRPDWLQIPVLLPKI